MAGERVAKEVGGAALGAAAGVGLFYGGAAATTSAVGLTAAGPVAGGTFAAAQAAGSVVAGSSWAGLQSVAMGGVFGPVGLGVMAGVVTVSALAGWGISMLVN